MIIHTCDKTTHISYYQYSPVYYMNHKYIIITKIDDKTSQKGLVKF